MGEQIRFLADNPARRGTGTVFTNVSANWMDVRKAGWRVFWCSTEQKPVGTVALPEKALEQSLSDMIRQFWNTEVADKRLVGDIVLGTVEKLAPLLFVTSGSGGVGKTVTSRRLCERAAAKGVRSLLIDGNMLQSSQRSFFDPARRMDARTILDWRDGEKTTEGANRGKRFGVEYDITFAPQTGAVTTWTRYAEYINQARKLWQFVVVDLDRISAVDLRDPDTAAGALVTPYVKSGDLCLYIVKAGRQTQADAMAMMSVLPEVGIPRECFGIKDSIPMGMEDYTSLDYSRYGTFLGAEWQTDAANRSISEGKSNWPDPKLDYVREKVLAWAMPQAGFTPDEFKPKERRRWGFR